MHAARLRAQHAEAFFRETRRNLVVVFESRPREGNSTISGPRPSAIRSIVTLS